ncbi:hypothetical protein BV22DRAFT_1034047 [Leucogyrophana mollusca]|uniref:Uncharacterized protein n=1 Tax=Leucogyrophana mollusca TaxID=85980 RepID=A0ACB8BLE2_9AGAM|nr:hypothetical protein BV22DRAFT_1034047 [Leucogyrophana mollusca]
MTGLLEMKDFEWTLTDVDEVTSLVNPCSINIILHEYLAAVCEAVRSENSIDSGEHRNFGAFAADDLSIVDNILYFDASGHCCSDIDSSQRSSTTRADVDTGVELVAAGRSLWRQGDGVPGALRDGALGTLRDKAFEHREAWRPNIARWYVSLRDGVFGT